jgi:hypothetical protein
MAGVVAVLALTAGCDAETAPSTTDRGRPAAIEQFRASDGLYAVPQLMAQKPPTDVADTAFWVCALALTDGSGRAQLAPRTVAALRPLVNAERTIDRLWLASMLEEQTGADLVDDALVRAVLRLQRPDGFFAPADAPAAQLDQPRLVDYSFRAAEGLRQRDRSGWLPRLESAAAGVTPAAARTEYGRYQLSRLRSTPAAVPAASESTGTVTATPPSSSSESEHVFDLLAQAQSGRRIDPATASAWVTWLGSVPASAAEYYVVSRALAAAGAPRQQVARLHADVQRASQHFERGDGTYFAYSETAGDLKSSYLYLLVSTITTGGAWQDPQLVQAAERTLGAKSQPGPFATWDRFLAERVTELAGSGVRIHSLETHPAWVPGLEKNIRSLPENVAVAVDAGVVVPELWHPAATKDPGMLAHLYVANWLARASTPEVTPDLLADWRRLLEGATSRTANRERYLTAGALLLADPRGDTGAVTTTIAAHDGAESRCGGLAFLVRTASGSSECDIQASLARSLFQLASRGESLEDALAP